MTNLHLHDEQMVNRLRKIAWASVFRLKWQHIYLVPFSRYIYGSLPFPFSIYIYTVYSIYIETKAYICTQKKKLMGNGNFRWIAANRKQKWHTSVSLLQMETENSNSFCLVQTINGNQRLLFQQTHAYLN